ncbi:MAG: TraX family protein [Bacillota bacterium]
MVTRSGSSRTINNVYHWPLWASSNTYNGKRGKPLKWIFYIYYPAHLLIFACLSNVLQ